MPTIATTALSIIFTFVLNTQLTLGSRLFSGNGLVLAKNVTTPYGLFQYAFTTQTHGSAQVIVVNKKSVKVIWNGVLGSGYFLYTKDYDVEEDNHITDVYLRRTTRYSLVAFDGTVREEGLVGLVNSETKGGFVYVSKMKKAVAGSDVADKETGLEQVYVLWENGFYPHMTALHKGTYNVTTSNEFVSFGNYKKKTITREGKKYILEETIEDRV